MSIKKTNLSAIEVGLYFLHLGNKAGKPITNKKLQKLVYYAQAWSLVINKKRLFLDRIEAWVHGPAVRALYSKYKEFGYSPIKQEVNEDIVSIFLPKDKKLLDNVWKAYGKLDSEYLEMLTHSEKPWQEAREGLQSDESSSKEISLETIGAYYLEKLKSARKS
jgi:uncharacterized phage-associated protein